MTVAHWRDKDQFKDRVRVWSDKLGVHVRSLAVRPMRNKWASCSTAGNLNFSDDLLALDRELADYVIVHELLHFMCRIMASSGRASCGRIWATMSVLNPSSEPRPQCSQVSHRYVPSQSSVSRAACGQANTIFVLAESPPVRLSSRLSASS